MDWSLRAAVFVAVGAAIGGVLRYASGVWLTRDDHPAGTLFVNLLGSFLIALLMFGGLPRGLVGPDARTFLATGILGGFTTMSSFTYETIAFLDDGEHVRAVAYAGITFGGCLGAALAGRWLAMALPGGA